jgi:hypothetical protein
MPLKGTSKLRHVPSFLLVVTRTAGLLSIEGLAPKNPMVGIFAGCCARAASGHAAAAPPSSVMNARRLN